MYSFIQKIKRILFFIPIIWKGYDWDYISAIDLFKGQLQRQYKYMISNKAISSDSKHQASRIKTAINLIDFVYNNDNYDSEWQKKVFDKYGSDALDFCEKSHKSGFVHIYYKYEDWKNADEIRKYIFDIRLENGRKVQKAHDLLWRFIEHNIKNWWD